MYHTEIGYFIEIIADEMFRENIEVNIFLKWVRKTRNAKIYTIDHPRQKQD